jgi:polar amino acid transport system substrate-binding protein
MPRYTASIVALGWAILAACTAPTANEAVRTLQELAPTGKLRVGIAVGAVTSAFWTTKDSVSGRPQGVTVDLGADIASKLGVPIELVVYNNSGEVTAAGARGEWDVAFMPVDAERAKIVDFGPTYFLIESTYLVPAGSSISSIADVDRPGTRVLAIENTTTARSAARSLKNTSVMTCKTVDELYAAMRAGAADAIALSRDALDSFALKFPGARVLPGYFQATGIAIAVPKGHPTALAYVSAYIEQAKSSGQVRRALDNAGLKGAPVAPAAMLN